MGQKVYYNGVYGEQSIKLVREIINIIPLDDVFSKSGYSIKSHAHRNLFQIFVLEKGKIELLANNEKYSVSKPSVLTIPQSVLTVWSLRRAPKVFSFHFPQTPWSKC